MLMPGVGGQNQTIAFRLEEYLARLSPRKKILMSFLLGGLSALAFVPVSAVAILIPALVGLFWLVHGASGPRRAFLLGWAFGVGHFLVGLYWIGNAFFVYAERHALLAVPGILGMAIVLGIYTGLISLLYRALLPHCFCQSSVSWRHVLLFATLWTVFEWIRSWAFTGFPWNLLGSVWMVSDEIIQVASLGGVYLLSLITVFVAVLPAILVSNSFRCRFIVLSGFALIGVLWVGGAWRLSGVETEYVEGVMLRLVQPNIAQRLKWQPDLRLAHVETLVRLSRQPALGTVAPSHVIWPETAVPYSVPGRPELLSMLRHAVPPDGILIGGALRRGQAASLDGGPPARPVVWNSLFVLDQSGRILPGYDKMHLVPFGEYVPFQDILPIEKLTDGAVGFSFGDGPRRLDVPGLPALSPLICYEVIFPGQVVEPDSRPSWILNITNDAWYGYSAGPFQHFAAARLRAVEEGLPVVRVANTGISGIIDGYGRTLKSIKLETTGVLDGALPKELPVTLFARYGVKIPLLICLGIFLYFMVSWGRFRWLRRQ